MNGIDPPKGRVAVYDDDHFYMGSVLAELMAKAGHTVSYLTPLPTVATWTDLTLEQSKIIGRLNELGVALHPNTVLDSTGGFQNTLTSTALTHAYDHLVFVGARLPEDDLFEQLKTRSDIGALYRAGDCVVPGTIQAAVLSGHMTARQILERQTSLPDIKREQIAF